MDRLTLRCDEEDFREQNDSTFTIENALAETSEDLNRSVEPWPERSLAKETFGLTDQ